MDRVTKELLKYREDAEKKTDKELALLLLAYKQALEEVRRELGYMYVMNAKDGVIKSREVEKISKDIQKSIVDQAKKIGDIEQKLTKNILNNTYKDTYNRTMEILKSSNVVLDEKLIDKVINTTVDGKLFSDRIWKNKELLVNRLQKEIKNAIIKGVDIDKIANNITKTFGTSAYESRRLVQTEMARVLSNVQKEIYKKDENVKWVRFDATIDSRTSEMCLELHGKVFDADSDYPVPPIHPFCRSVIVPIEDVENIVKDDSKNLRTNKYQPTISNIEWDKYLDLTKENSEQLNGINTRLNKFMIDNNREKIELLSLSKNKIVYTLEGVKQNEVMLDKGIKSVLKKSMPNDIILVHNHPSTTTFSSADILKFCEFKSIKALTLECIDGTKYFIDRGNVKSGLFGYNSFYNKYSQIYDSVAKEIPELKDKIKIYEVWDDFIDKVNNEVAREFKMKYKEVN